MWKRAALLGQIEPEKKEKRNWHKSLSLTSPELELLSEMIEDAVASITHGAVQDADSEMLHWTVILTKQF